MTFVDGPVQASVEAERFRLLVESIADYAIYMLNIDGTVASWNAGAQRFKGYAANEIIGQHFSRFYTDEDRATDLPVRALKMAAEEGKFEQEGWRVRKDGTRMWAHVIIDPVRDHTGQLVGFAKVTRDITERHEAQRQLEEAREAVFRSQKSEALGQLTGGVAHDFNNLLMVILGSLELAQKRLPDDPRLQRHIENAMQAAHRGATLTQRMLSFSRRQELKVEPVDISTLVRDMLEMLERSIGPSVTIRTNLPRGLAPAFADSNQLELAILNLAVNARDAMPEGGLISILAADEKVETARADGLVPGDYTVIKVQDTGSGMDEETLARAVEPFFTTKGIGKGTGLGLSMVHGTTQQLGGAFVLKSRPGAGTSAELWLRSAPHSAATASPPQVAPGSVDESHHASIVLAVDDDPLVLSSITDMLEDLGFEVIAASSGPAALQMLDTVPLIDLVITDHAMPNMTGLELISTLRRLRPELPVVLASGYAEFPDSAPEDVTRLGKPFLQSALADAVATALG